MLKNEQDFNFFIELHKSLNDTDICVNENVCLITHEPLEENHIKLRCGHKFNYDAIYIDVYNHKKKFNLQEMVKLKTHQIRCPYCRNIQNEILPHYEGKDCCYGVNTLNNKIIILYCNKVLSMGKNKGQTCKNICFKNMLCKRHYNMEIKKQIVKNNAIVEEV